MESAEWTSRVGPTGPACGRAHHRDRDFGECAGSGRVRDWGATLPVDRDLDWGGRADEYRRELPLRLVRPHAVHTGSSVERHGGLELWPRHEGGFFGEPATGTAARWPVHGAAGTRIRRGATRPGVVGSEESRASAALEAGGRGSWSREASSCGAAMWSVSCWKRAPRGDATTLAVLERGAARCGRGAWSWIEAWRRGRCERERKSWLG